MQKPPGSATLPSGVAQLQATLQSGLRAHQSGDFTQAEVCYRKVLQTDGNNSEAIYLLGVIALQAASPKRAIELFQRAIKINPDHAWAYFHLGLALSETGDLEGAAGALGETVRIEPASAEALMNFGIVLMQMGRTDEGLDYLHNAAELDPGEPETHLNLATALLQVNRLDDADGALGMITGPAAREPGVAFIYGQLRERQNRSMAAAQYFRDVLAIVPDDPDAHLSLGKMLLAMGQLEEAEFHTRRSLELEPSIPERYCNLGLIMKAAGRRDEAASCYRRAGQPGLVHLADMLRQEGQFDQVPAVIDELRTLNPEHPCVYTLGSEFGHIKMTDDVRRKARDIARLGQGNVADIADLHISLGRSHEKDGEYDDAFEYFRRANELLSAGLGYNRQAEQRHFEAITEAFSLSLFQRLAGMGNPSEVPTFVVGMMRSGTSLVEQIIASHPLAEGAGELNNLIWIQNKISEAVGGDRSFAHSIPHMDRELSRRLADDYLDHLRGFNPAARRVVDKMPGNFIRLGLIALLFPGARIVHCVRDPLDTCFSIYQNRFNGNHPYAYGLADVGHYYHLYDQLMAHWQSVLPLPIHEFRYENMVADPESSCRSLIDFLGLQWDPACLEFHTNNRMVRTVSMWQVRQPLYATSIGRWRKYDNRLDDLKAALVGSL